MLKRILSAFVALGVLVGGLLAAEGVIVKLEKRELTVKVGTEEKTYKLEKGIKFVDEDGTTLKGKEARTKLKAGVKVAIEETDGKVTEIKIKK